MQQRWPDRLWIVRYGESAANVARDAVQAARADFVIELPVLERALLAAISLRGHSD